MAEKVTEKNRNPAKVVGPAVIAGLGLAGLAMFASCSSPRETFKDGVLQPSPVYSKVPLSLKAKLDGCILSMEIDALAAKLRTAPGSYIELRFTAYEDGDLGKVTFSDPQSVTQPSAQKQWLQRKFGGGINPIGAFGSLYPNTNVNQVTLEDRSLAAGSRKTFIGSSVFSKDPFDHSHSLFIPPISESIRVNLTFYKRIGEKNPEKAFFIIRPNMQPVVASNSVIGLRFNKQQSFPSHVMKDANLIASLNSDIENRIYFIPIDTNSWQAVDLPFYSKANRSQGTDTFIMIPEQRVADRIKPRFLAETKNYISLFLFQRMNATQLGNVRNLSLKIRDVLYSQLSTDGEESEDEIEKKISKSGIPRSFSVMLPADEAKDAIYEFFEGYEPFVCDLAMESLIHLGAAAKNDYTGTLASLRSLEAKDKEVITALLRLLDDFKNLPGGTSFYRELFPAHETLEKLRNDLKDQR